MNCVQLCVADLCVADLFAAVCVIELCVADLFAAVCVTGCRRGSIPPPARWSSAVHQETRTHTHTHTHTHTSHIHTHHTYTHRHTHHTHTHITHTHHTHITHTHHTHSALSCLCRRRRRSSAEPAVDRNGRHEQQKDGRCVRCDAWYMRIKWIILLWCVVHGSPFLLCNDDMFPFRPPFPPYNYLLTYTTNWEDLIVGEGAQGPVSQNYTSNPSNSSRALGLSRTVSNPCSPKKRTLAPKKTNP